MSVVGAATAPHRKIYPRSVHGPLRTLRASVNTILQTILFVGPWLWWHGQRAILIDLARRRLHFFGLTFWPHETYFLLIVLIFLAITLFASTAVAGRMWCGYACPQTLLTESFVLVERLVEGKWEKRKRLDASAWSWSKAARKALKYSIWGVMSIWLGVTLVSYFMPSSEILSSSGATAAVLFLAGATYFNLGFFREQMCHFVCPYARFQGAMFDPDTLIVGYDAGRGEPRGKLGKTSGDCIDCRMCVQVCPMGIDIRNGLQLECIACTACLDACNHVMDRVGKPHGLIRYCSLNALQSKSARVMRPRLLVYGSILTALAALFVFLVAQRPLVAMDVVRGGDPFSRTLDGRLSNLYTMKLINKDSVPHSFQLSVSGVSGTELVAPQNPLAVAADTAVDVKVFVLHAAAGIGPVSSLVFEARDGKLAASRRSTFIALPQGARP